MKNIIKNISLAIGSCLIVSALFSCNGNETTSGTRSTDSVANASKTTTTATSTDTSNSSTTNGAGTAGNTSGGSSMTESNKMSSASTKSKEQSMEPTGPATLSVSSPAFGSGNVIPVKYTCDGQGATPPLSVTNIPTGTKSLALIVHDYEATPEGGFTYWLIWNLDTSGNIPENFVNNHEGMNAAKQYGYTPICAKSGNHKYHFIVYALDSKLVMPKTTTKSGLEGVMKGHVLGKGEVVGVYNKRLE